MDGNIAENAMVGLGMIAAFILLIEVAAKLLGG